MARNVLGGELESCGTDPMTGFHRDGCCNTDGEDAGVHTVCAVMTAEFLRFSTGVGNDLVTPRPKFGFPGCDQAIAGVWARASGCRRTGAGVAPPVVLAATHARSLEWIDLADLRRAAVT